MTEKLIALEYAAGSADWEQYMKFIEYHFMNIEPRSVTEVYKVQ